MRPRLRLSLVLFSALLPSLALALPAGLEAKARSAFSYIAKAKSALNAGHTTASQGFLAKAESRLKSVLDGVPGGKLLGKLDEGSAAAKQDKPQQSNNALAQAEQEAAKLDPSLAGKLGVAKDQAAQGDTSGVGQVRQEAAQKTGLGGLESIYQRVSQARSALEGGETAKAKALLDELPSSPLAALKSLR